MPPVAFTTYGIRQASMLPTRVSTEARGSVSNEVIARVGSRTTRVLHQTLRMRFWCSCGRAKTAVQMRTEKMLFTRGHMYG